MFSYLKNSELDFSSNVPIIIIYLTTSLQLWIWWKSES